jgi:hypothetical protein
MNMDKTALVKAATKNILPSPSNKFAEKPPNAAITTTMIAAVVVADLSSATSRYTGALKVTIPIRRSNIVCLHKQIFGYAKNGHKKYYAVNIISHGIFKINKNY